MGRHPCRLFQASRKATAMQKESGSFERHWFVGTLTNGELSWQRCARVTVRGLWSVSRKLRREFSRRRNVLVYSAVSNRLSVCLGKAERITRVPWLGSSIIGQAKFHSMRSKIVIDHGFMRKVPLQ